MKKRLPEDMPPPEAVQHILNTLGEAWQSSGGLSIDSVQCGDHYHIYVFPCVRELVGGAQDGAQLYASFVVDLKKLMRCFDKVPKLFFDTETRGGMPFVIAFGRVKGIKCDISVMPCPPPNQQPMEIAYVEGPKAGTVEQAKPRPCVEDDDDD